MEEQKTYCMLIDADNVSYKYIEGILEEISKYGSCPIRRVFGDVSDASKKNWKEVCLNYSISPIQQYNYTVNKNATDSSMIINTMDLLYTKKIDGFVIVSSDSDFTGLAMRLREENKDVIGMGEKKTPLPFIKACTEFKYLENLVQDKDSDSKSIANVKDLKPIIVEILNRYDDSVNMSQLSEMIKLTQPDFDPRNYGYSKFKKLLEYFKDDFIINGYQVSLNSKKNKSVSYADVIKSIINDSKDKEVNIGELNQKMMQMIPDFDYRSLGYSRFPQFVLSFDFLQLKKNNVKLIDKKNFRKFDDEEDEVIRIETNVDEEDDLIPELVTEENESNDSTIELIEPESEENKTELEVPEANVVESDSVVEFEEPLNASNEISLDDSKEEVKEKPKKRHYSKPRKKSVKKAPVKKTE